MGWVGTARYDYINLFGKSKHVSTLVLLHISCIALLRRPTLVDRKKTEDAVFSLFFNHSINTNNFLQTINKDTQ
jgi:hypothetical protein